MHRKLVFFGLVLSVWSCFPLVSLADASTIWSKTYGGTGDDRVNSLVATLDGGYALAGSTCSFGSGDTDFWLAKTDEFGFSNASSAWWTATSPWLIPSLLLLTGASLIMALTLSILIRRKNAEFS